MAERLAIEPPRPPKGRHRAPSTRRAWPRAVLGVVALIAAVISVVGVVNLAANPGRTTANPGAASPSPAQTPIAAVTSEAPHATPTRSASPTATAPRWTPADAATKQVTAFDAAAEAAVPGALVHAADAGTRIDNSPIIVWQKWSAKRYPNAMTAAENNTLALRAGKVRTTADLPKLTTTQRVSVGGTTRTLPIASASDVAAGLTDTDGPDCPDCVPVELTDVTSTLMNLTTTEGTLNVPAWSYGVKGEKARVVVPALAPEALLTPSPTWLGEVPAKQARTMTPLSKVAVAKNPRVISARLDADQIKKRPGCWRLYATEGKHAVGVYAALGKAAPEAPCAVGGRVSVTLADPVGTRTLLDTYWRRALPQP